MTRPFLLGLGLILALVALAPDEPAPTDIGKSYRVPYRLTDTNHWLVRVKINGKGPFNFLVDSGAPALYVGTEAAKAVGITPPEDDFWTPIERLEIEGGATLRDVRARVEDPFQLVGMNALGLPGKTIDGILGYTILARFKLELDPTRDRMTWTRLAFEPREPFIPRAARNKQGPEAPAEIQVMQAMGPLMKFMALFVGKQPEDVLKPRGLLGIVLKVEDDGVVRIASVLKGTPADEAGLEQGDRLLEVNGRTVRDLASAQEAVKAIAPGGRATIKARRGDETIERELIAAEGF